MCVYTYIYIYIYMPEAVEGDEDEGHEGHEAGAESAWVSIIAITVMHY